MSDARIVITRIVPLAKDPNLRRVYVGKKPIALLRASDIERLKLREGLPWTEQLEDAVQSEHAALKARQDAMRMLGRRAYSRGELIERLLGRRHARDVAERIADELAADDWIDDATYARELVASVTRRKPASKAMLQSKLASRKIDPATADSAISQHAVESDAAAAVKLAQARWSTMKQLPRATAARRIAGALARRGFNDQSIADALEHIGLDQQSLADE